MKKVVLLNLAAGVLIMALVGFISNKGIRAMATNGEIEESSKSALEAQNHEDYTRNVKFKEFMAAEDYVEPKVLEEKTEVKDDNNKEKDVQDAVKEDKNTNENKTEEIETVSSSKESNANTESTPVKKDTTTTKESTGTEVVPFETIRKEDNSIEKGKEVVSQEGQNGSKTVTYKETFVNGTSTSKEVVNTTISKEPVNKVVKVGTKTTSQVTEVLNNSILSKNGNVYSYSDYGEVAVKVQTNGSKVTQITFDGMGYYGYQYVTKQLLINEYGEKEGKVKFDQNQQQMRNIESAIRSAANAVHGAGTSQANALYSQILNGGNSQNAYSVSF